MLRRHSSIPRVGRREIPGGRIKASLATGELGGLEKDRSGGEGAGKDDNKRQGQQAKGEDHDCRRDVTSFGLNILFFLEKEKKKKRKRKKV